MMVSLKAPECNVAAFYVVLLMCNCYAGNHPDNSVFGDMFSSLRLQVDQFS